MYVYTEFRNKVSAKNSMCVYISSFKIKYISYRGQHFKNLKSNPMRSIFSLGTTGEDDSAFYIRWPQSV